ncbi:MAG: Fic family protein [Bacilli bacterium]|nr:Fic family protein [Bacilli bacterium]
MGDYIKLDLIIDKKKNKKLYYNNKYLDSYKKDLDNFLSTELSINNIDFAKKMLMNYELQANNNIEGLVDSLESIDEVVNSKGKIIDYKDRKRIINLYKGYKYILQGKSINKDNLRELYSLLSDDLLEKRDLNNMGAYYRKGPVYIIMGNRLDIDPIQGMPYKDLDFYMDNYFNYINKNNMNNDINNFIKSQIMHYYFVYVHPFFDVNGRTSRTVSMWYLLNSKNYPYIVFNRAISYAKSGYDKTINKCRDRGEVTLFLEYMLSQVLKELEKESLIQNININNCLNLSIEEEQIIEYFINMNGNLTAIDLIRKYNEYNFKVKPKIIYINKIEPLIDKGIFKIEGYTKKNICEDVPNMWLKLNSKYVNMDKKKLKYLKIDKYI